MSKTRREYFVRLIGRIAILIATLVACILKPEIFGVLDGMRFFSELSVLHLLWALWVFDMFLQIVPIKHKLAISIGSMKLFASHFRPIRKKISTTALRNYVTTTSRAAYKVLLLWGGLIAVIGVLYFTGVISRMWLFFISVVFYVCDLICVLIWCPFRLIMKNKCCTTCRIFNWDHMMMFSPLIFAGGFYCISLVAFALAAWLVWEICVMLYPERFCEMTNAALKCSECTDKLCTQYCRKLR